jgi:hypothetical protein
MGKAPTRKPSAKKPSAKKTAVPAGKKRGVVSVGVDRVVAFVERLINSANADDFAQEAASRKLVVKVDPALQDFIAEFNTRHSTKTRLAAARRSSGVVDVCPDDDPYECFRR